MIIARSLLYVLLFYMWSAVFAIAMAPLLACPRGWTLKAMAMWGAGVTAMLEPVCNIRVEFRGRQHLPLGPALIAAKHQCMFDTMGPFTVLPKACYVMKKELMIIPFYGWYSAKGGMIVVDREGHSKALRKLVTDTLGRIKEGRQVVIFPEGHRQDPGTPPDYKPGIAALYRELDLPCTPMATNSGAHWPAHGFIRRPGTIVYEFLEPIAPGLKRAEFMRTLQDRIETASGALLAE